MNPQDQDFDWVTEHLGCSVAYEFAKLELAAKTAVEKLCQSEHCGPEIEIKFQSKGQKLFEVSRNRTTWEGASLQFCRNRKEIIVKDTRKETVVFKITLTLTEEGECRYQIDGKGEFLRWQVIRRALKPLFFGGDD